MFQSISGSEWAPDKLALLFLDLHCMYLYGESPETFALVRTIKCTDIDVKLIMKMALVYNMNPDGEMEVKARLSMNTDAPCLRKTRSIFSDTESVYHEVVLPTRIARQAEQWDELTAAYERFALEVIQKTDTFRVCRVCRILYKDPRTGAKIDRCVHCLFDLSIHPVDTNCVICNDLIRVDEQSYTLTCGHIYHAECILTHFVRHALQRRECPMCRAVDTS